MQLAAAGRYAPELLRVERAELNIDASHFRRVIHRARLRLVEALARIGITEMD